MLKDPLRFSDVHNRVLRNTKCDLAIHVMRTAYKQNSFAFRGADTWNNLHKDVKLPSSTQSFQAVQCSIRYSIYFLASLIRNIFVSVMLC